MQYVANFVAIGQTVDGIWRFIDFKMAVVRHLGFAVCVLDNPQTIFVVFIVVKILFRIHAVVSIICTS